MKLTTLLKEVKAKKKVNEAMSFEFEIDAQGNLEIYDTYGDDGRYNRLLAVVDKSTGTIDYKTGSMVRKDQIRAAAERFLDDESDQSDSSSMYADRFSESMDEEVKPQSPVSWLHDELDKILELYPSEWDMIAKAVAQAKELEKQERDNAYEKGYKDASIRLKGR
jgi:hypothetical protein